MFRYLLYLTSSETKKRWKNMSDFNGFPTCFIFNYYCICKIYDISVITFYYYYYYYYRSDPCRLNLGGRCATEIASDLVKAWHYLNSSNSPGRKRRDVREALRTILRHSAATAASAAAAAGDNHF